MPVPASHVEDSTLSINEDGKSPQSTLRFELPENPVLSIIIPIHNQLGYTLGCLQSIKDNPPDCSFEVIIVDDESSLDTFQSLCAIDGLRVIRNFRNLGFVRSCNRSGNLARGRYLLLLNNDTRIQPDCLNAMVRVFTTRPDAGLVGAKLVYPDGTLQEAGGICWNDGSAWNFGRNCDPAMPEYNYLKQVDYVSGACIMFPRQLWSELGGFDEVYAPAYYEDTDFAFRVRAAGRKVYYQPKAVVVHYEGKSNGTDTGAGIKSYQSRNRHIFFARWQNVLAQNPPNGQRVFSARDRSYGRPTILVIDHYVPHFDRDAGSRNMMNYLYCFLEAGFNVKFIGDNFFPHQPYTDFLQELGIEVLYGNHYAANWEKWLEENGGYIDYVFLSRAHISRRWLKPLRRFTRAPLLFYGHDLLSRTLNRAFLDLGDESYRQESIKWKAYEEEVFSAVDWIFYPSADEVRLLKETYPEKNIARLPLYAFGPPAASVPLFSERSGLLFVGNFGHHPNLDGVLWFVKEIFPELLRQIPDLHLTIVGTNPPPEVKSLSATAIQVRPNVSDAELSELYRRHRLAVVPLRYGGGIKGKVLGAMHEGTPVVTTAIGAEGLTWSGAHMVISTEGGYAAAVVSLYKDESQWNLVQREGWSFLAKEYSRESLRRAMSTAIREFA